MILSGTIECEGEREKEGVNLALIKRCVSVCLVFFVKLSNRIRNALTMNSMKFVVL